MLKLDNNLLQELGLGSLPEDQKKAMLQHIYDTLELRVGTQLANQMTDQQLQEFEQFIDSGGDASQAQALQWLETNLPNYKQVVNDVFEALKGEVKQMAPQIVAAAAQQPAVPAAAAPQMPGASDPYQQASAAPQYAQQQPSYGQPISQPADPYQSAAPAPGSAAMPPAGYQQPAAPAAMPQYDQQFGQPAQQQPIGQPQYAQPDPTQQFNPQPTPQQGSTQASSYPPQPSAGSQPQFPGQQPPAGPGQ
ncbi:hypothetical protein EYC59_02260 [Candidatus Saccharibacteria bacterium]|nr:MAG: hypothetical protein EYC59_02260 [Candidatus Saccharibacteria bacterium]